jgi:hypothetical protein
MPRDRVTLLGVMIGFVALFASAGFAQGNALKIVVIAGEDAVNVIQQKTAVAPIVEVRDRNDLPVAGATVVFTINGSGAAFGASQTLTVVTNAAGQATATGLTPSATGAFRISARATFQGQTATATIAQSNVMTATEAAKAARPGSAASSGGMSAGKIIAIVGGIGAVGGGVAVAAASSKGDSSSSSSTAASATSSPTTTTPVTTTPTTPAAPSNSAPVITSATITPNSAWLALNTPIALQVQASDADNDPLTYLWEFPDGSRSDQRAFTRTFQLGGTWRIRITVSDGRTSTSSELTLEMKTITGSWDLFRTGADAVAQFDLVQTGSTIEGVFFNITTPDARCRTTGTFRAAAPQVQMTNSACARLSPTDWTLTVGSDADVLTGTLQNLDGPREVLPVTLRRKR